MLVFSARAYRSEQLLVMAEGGRKTVADYERLLLAAVATNPYNAQAHLRLSDLYLSRNRYEESLKELHSSSTGRNHWRGWERAGLIYEKVAFSPAGTEEEIGLAARYYDKVLRVYPSYQTGLERRALLALKAGEWKLVEDIADSLEELDANSGNVLYIRARAAEGAGNTEVAEKLYTRLAARDLITTGALYTPQDVANRLNNFRGPQS